MMKGKSLKMITIVDALEKHIDDIFKIEVQSFDIPWSRVNFEREIKNNKFAFYVVAYDDENDKIVGYGGMWHVVNEGHITNIAVLKEYRRQGIGMMIIRQLEKIAKDKEMIGLTLEVRRGNQDAISLYRKNRFIMSGIRKEYYSDTKEDAIIMWKYFESEN